MQDNFGRKISYLRLSVTDRCDFRCSYCMAEKMEFVPRHEILSLEECLLVARAFIALGVSKIRLTGGEPLLRRGVPDLVARIAALRPRPEISITTNGILLGRDAAALAGVGEPAGRAARSSLGLSPGYAMVDTGAAEFRKFADLIDLSRIEVYGAVSDGVLERLHRKARMLGSGTVAVHELHAGFVR